MNTIDVIVPCYRYAHFLCECVQSVVTQQGVNLRVLVINDASPDNTGEVAAELAGKDARVIVSTHTTNKGHIATYNEGIAWACADYLLLLSADDYLLPGALKRATEILDSNANVGFTFGKAYVLDEVSGGLTAFTLDNARAWNLLSGREFIERSGSRNLVLTPTAVVRTELQKRVGGYREELPHTGDMEMWLRLAAHSSVGILEGYLAVHRRHAKNMSLSFMTQRKLPDLEQRKAALELFLETCAHVLEDPVHLQRRLFKGLGYDALGYAAEALDIGEEEASEALKAFAYGVYPSIKNSIRWQILGWQRAIGPLGRKIVRPAFNALRLAKRASSR